jgi:hypothetical protein
MIPALLMLLALDTRTAALIEQISRSGRMLELSTPARERLAPSARIAPGAPPLLGFRMIQGRLRHRFGDLDLVVDDAGH